MFSFHSFSITLSAYNSDNVTKSLLLNASKYLLINSVILSPRIIVGRTGLEPATLRSQTVDSTN
jgi:hypothetical protein